MSECLLPYGGECDGEFLVVFFHGVFYLLVNFSPNLKLKRQKENNKQKHPKAKTHLSTQNNFNKEVNLRKIQLK